MSTPAEQAQQWMKKKAKAAKGLRPEPPPMPDEKGEEAAHEDPQEFDDQDLGFDEPEPEPEPIKSADEPEEPFVEPEYAEDDAKIAREPGLPDELVKELAEEPTDIADLNLELIAENSPILLMALVAIALTETVKGMGLRLMLRKRGVEQDTKETIYRLVLFAVSAAAANTIGFRRLVLDVTGVSLSWFESIVYGGAIVSVIAAVIYSMKLTKALKKWIYAKFGTTEEEMAQPTVRKQPAVTAEDLEKIMAEHNGNGGDDGGEGDNA